MAFYPVAGCKFFIGTPVDEKPTDHVVADFSSIVWTEVTKWTQMGDLGDEASPIPLQVIGEGREKTQKGTRNAGTMQNIFAVVPGDAGQDAMRAAEKTQNNYAFKIELNDKPAAGASPKNGVRYFVGLVMSARETGGAANTVRNLAATVNINSNIVGVPASAS